MKTPRTFSQVLLGFSLAATSLHAAPGDLDSTFGTGGKVTTSIGSGDDRGQAVALQGDGKVVVAGYSYNGSNNDFAVVRYNADGTLDTSFGTGGKVTTDFGGTNDIGNGVAVQADGKIIVVGGALSGSSQFALARYNTDGTLDTGFGLAGTGKIKTAIGSANNTTQATAVKVQGDGKILVTGYALTSNSYDFALVRYNADGTLDTGFGTGGMTSVNISDHDYAMDLAVQPDGRVVVVGYSRVGGPSYPNFAMVRFSAGGVVESGFPVVTSYLDGYKLALQPDGKIIVAGTTTSGVADCRLVRYNADGTLDTGFGSSGAVTTGIGTADDGTYGVAVQSDGRIVAAGYTYNANTGFYDFAVLRYQSTGALDTSFQSTGKVTTSFSGGSAVARGMVIAPDGRIIVAGYAHDGTSNNFALARYFGSGSLATSAPAHGSHTANNQPVISGTATAGFTVNVHVNGSGIGTTVADGAGAWSFTPSSPLADGAHTAAATETDGFGNTGPLSNAVSFTVDTTAPAAPVITTPANNTLMNTTWPVISGTAEAGATVAVHIDDVLVGTVVASSNGTWSFSPVNALLGGLHNVKVAATDRAGNAGAFSTVVSFSTTPPLFVAPGTLDTGFGTGGKVLTPIGSGEDRGHAVALQSDGKVVVAGYSHNGSNKDFCVVRYNADGTLDTGFGTGGKVVTDFGGSNDTGNGVVVQADGKIVVVGGSLSGSNSQFALVRYHSDGTLDTGFGLAGTGKIKTAIGVVNNATQATAVKILGDGKILVAGYALTGWYDFALARYNSDGTLDNSYGTGGVTTVNISDHDYAMDLAVQPDGRVVVVGYGRVGGPEYPNFTMVRFSSNGVVEPGFPVVTSYLDGHALALQPDGKIIVAGTTRSGVPDYRLVRYNADGTLDTGFGSGGTVTTGIGTVDDVAYGVAVQSDGRIVAAGYSYNANTGFNDFSVVRYHTNGALDTSFQSTGKVTTSFSGGNALVRGMLIAPDGRILVAGYARNGANDDFALAQYFGSGSLATSVPAHGSFTSNNQPVISGTATAGFTVNVRVDGNVIGTTVADGAGAWSFTPSSPLADGAHTAAATETDGFGNTGPLSNAVSFTVDTTAPVVPVITTPANNTLVSTSYPLISGTVEAGVTVTIYIDNTVVGTAVASSNGSWSFTPVNALSSNLHSVKATATDRAGNASGFSSVVSFSTTGALLGGPGTLDTSFGNGGKVVTPIGAGDDRGQAMVLQSDGKAVVAGYSFNGSNNDFAVVRYNADGTLDTGFGTSGKVTTDFGGTRDEVNGLAIQPDGKIVAVGMSWNTGSNVSVFALARYHQNGTLDTSFGLAGTGKVKTAIGSVMFTDYMTQAWQVRVMADGKLLVSGNATFSTNDYVLARYNANGTLDETFAVGGAAVINPWIDDYPFDMAIQNDGKVVMAGYGQVGGTRNPYFTAARFNNDGTSDNTFAPASLSMYGFGLVLQTDGKIVIAGTNLAGAGSRDFQLARYNANGSLDGGFGTSGVTLTGIGTADDLAYDVALQTDGRIVAAGFSYNADTGFNDFAVVRYNSNGTLDTSFKSTGKVLGGFTSGSAVGRSMVIAPDGRIIVAGYAHDGTKNNFALARYFGTDQPPIVTTGDATGIVRTGAVLNGTVNPNSLATTAYFEYGTTTSYGSTSSSVNLGNGYLAAPTAITIGGLTDNTLYHYRLVATNAAGTTYGADATFTTAPNPPLAFTGDAANVSASGATLVGVVIPNGRDTTAYFEFGLSTAYGAQTDSQLVPASGTIENVFAPLTGLVAGATYHFRLVAINAGSPIPITGVDKTFVAQAPPPVVTLGAVAPLTTTSVNLSGTVNANGASTQVFFDYGTDGSTFPNSVTASPATVSGTNTTAVSGSFSSLSQGVTYHYRLRAVSAGGTTTSSVATFTLDLLSGLNQTFPGAAPDAQGFVFVNLSPSGILHGWRFVGEQQWRASGVPASGLTTGTREIEFRPVPGRIQPPQEVVSVISGEAATVLTRDYYDAATSGSGGLTVTLKPDSITTGAGRAQWRLLGEDDTQWRDNGTTITSMIPGSYLIECKPVTGHTTPTGANVSITAGQTSALTITYFVAEAQTGTPPAELAFSTVSTDQSKPFAHVGQLRSTVGSSTGFVVKARVVATAAHVVFDDGTLSAVQGLQWLFQRHRGIFEPKPIAPRGYYLFDGYTAQRAADNSPGQSSPQSQHLDVAALYFDEDAGRGGYGGFLASDLSANEFLLSSANKMLVGYPVDGIATTSQGRMHATTPMNVSFSAAYGRTFTTADIRSFGGNSGGPLCVQFEGGNYYPAAIYLGGTNQTVVRAIDSAVIDLFNRAETSGNGGGNNTGGGITHTSVTVYGSSSNPGALKVLIEPAGAVNGGAGWRLSPETTYRASGAQKLGLNAGTYVLQLIPVAGYDAPAAQSVAVTGGQLTTLTYTYAQPLTPQESWRQTNFGITGNTGSAADEADPDGDGMNNVAEYTAGTNPNSAVDRFRVHSHTKSGSTFNVTTAGKTGRTYILERTTSFNPASWGTVAVQGPLGGDATLTLTDTAAPAGTAFYRIRVTGP